MVSIILSEIILCPYLQEKEHRQPVPGMCTMLDHQVPDAKAGTNSVGEG